MEGERNGQGWIKIVCVRERDRKVRERGRRGRDKEIYKGREGDKVIYRGREGDKEIEVEIGEIWREKERDA